MQCEYCQKAFASIGSLTKHLKRAKYCLKLRGETPNESVSFTCNDCGFLSTDRHSHERHLRTCKGALGELPQDKFDREVAHLQKKLDEKDNLLAQKDEEYEKKMKEKDDIIVGLTYRVRDLETELKIYKSQSEKAQDALVDIAKRPTTTNTNHNNVNNIILQLKPLDYSVENVEEMLRVMEPETFKNGQRGLAQHLIKEMFTTPDGDRKMICTDPSRDIFKYLDLDKNIAKDCKLYNLIEMCVDAGLQNKIREFTTYINDQDIDNSEKCILFQVAAECIHLKHNNSEFRSEFREQLTN